MNKFVPVILIFLLAIFVSIMVGPAQLTSEIIQLRLSRVILGIFAGGILAFCGGVLQGLFGNPLVEPYTLGSASGAALGGSIGILLFGTISPLFAFFGSLGVGFFVFTVARIEGGLLRDRLILAGVVMSFLCSSLVMIIMVMGGRELYEILYLLMGYLGIIINAENRLFIILMIVLSAVLMLFLYRYHRELDIISQGLETAAGLGIDIQKFSVIIFLITSLLIGLTVSLVGAIGFVGLVIPHISKLLFGPKHLYNLPASFILGATFLLLADTVSRIITVYELPVGVVTSLIGVPFFIYLYRK
ncbi:MAG: iron ABC transporter permease [Candidatus Stahlbacteria bacterium]|nr:iron ABC transporter permease [candidate division WOR-3 bacterium]MCK4755484.1 iron ABC transporter permease [candidate division WOR-3 bacterium]NOR17022.1 iron chelate uptake ABC transporter family permease subunit [candidate division WOR-3 bacterium]TET63561.1 MAG: iron ABC transporter permease [Candidatus Stahlbacteria bacterium]